MATPCSFPSSTDLAGFSITLANVTYLSNGNSVWTYSITNLTQQTALSNWVLQLCFSNGDPIVSCTPPPGAGETCEETNPAGDPNVCTDASITTAPCLNQPLRGIKFNTSLDVGQTKTYSFVLNQPFAQELTCFGFKFGTNVACGLVCGPSPDCTLISPPVFPTRGIIA